MKKKHKGQTSSHTSVTHLSLRPANNEGMTKNSIHTQLHFCTHSHTHSISLSFFHTHTHTYTHTQRHRHRHRHTYITSYKRTDTKPHTHIHSYKHTCTHVRTRTH